MHPAVEIAVAHPRRQTRRITDSPPDSQTRQHVAIVQRSGRHPRAPQHRVAAATPGRRPPARRGHEYQGRSGRSQLGQSGGPCLPQRPGQIAASPFLRREYGLPRRATVRAQRPARHPRVDPRVHPDRWTGQAACAGRAPRCSPAAAARAFGRHDQIQQCPHTRECAAGHRHGKRGTQPGSIGAASAPKPGTSRQ